ncbi:MAG: M13 family metallopeptidase [Chloroflexia bacterium]|nr:M13 family metallopeptidase [Chloroflexia bacterium]
MIYKLQVAAAFVLALLLGAPGALAAQLQPPAAGRTDSPINQLEAAAHGSLLDVIDPKADPGRDFFRYATGGWQDRTEIPPDEAAYGVAQVVEDLTIEQLLELLDRLATSDQLPEGSDEWKAVQFFAQAMDLETRNAQGIAPIAGDLAAIDEIANLEEYYAFLRDAVLTTNVWGLFGIGGWADYADSSVYTAWYSGPFLGLPNRDYYWVDDESNEVIRESYRDTAAALLEYAGYDAVTARDAAARVYAFEKVLAEPILAPEDWNDPENYYHPRPVADLIAANPSFDWPGFLTELGIPDQETIVVQELEYLGAVEAIVQETDLETLKDYLKLQVLWFTAPTLTEEIGQTAFAFTDTTLWGVEEQPPLAERALDAVNGGLGFALGKLYVDEHFPPEAKMQVEALVDGLIDATGVRIDRLTWMSPETKALAKAKLDAMSIKIAYPDVWQTYDGVTIEDSFTQTTLSAGIVEYKRWLDRIGKPVDREEWVMLPQEVNAYYNPSNNEIVFPAGILQPPFFDYQADLAYNYGSIGGVIGHEITHAYDQSGSNFDAAGNLVNWWTDEDHARFEALTTEVADQYSTIEVLPRLFVDGELTIGENIADMGGLQIAYDALQMALETSGDTEPIEGLTPDQRFFIAFAYSWAEEARAEFLDTLIKSDVHAPAQIRAVQPARNMDAFMDAFAIEPGDPVYLAPEDRIVIW